MTSPNRLNAARGVVVAVMALWTLPTFAEEGGKPQAVRIQGTIEKSDEQTIAIQTANGSSPVVGITAQTLIVRNEPSSLDRVKPGDFIASAAERGKDGKLHSTELRIFP